MICIWNAVSGIKIRLFADGTNLFLHDKDYKTLVSVANYNLNKLSEGLSVNKLSLNERVGVSYCAPEPLFRG